MEDIIGQITLIAFAAFAVALPVYVIVRSIINLVRASDGRGTIVFKALVVIAVWIFLSFSLVMLLFMAVFEVDQSNPAAGNRRINILAVVFTLIYGVIGLALAYWTRLQPGWKTLRKMKSET